MDKIKRGWYHCMLGLSMERIVTMFQAYWGHVKSMLGANWEKINVVLDSDEHQA